MKCSKCLNEFPENELDLSHDIPKYMGGTDLDGRHYLCKQCHDKYELEVIKRSFMYLVKKFPEWRSTCRIASKRVKEEFFKNAEKV